MRSYGLDIAMVRVGERVLFNILRLFVCLSTVYPAIPQPLPHLSASNAPVEVLSGGAPLQHLGDAALGLHAARAIVQVRKLVGDLKQGGGGGGYKGGWGVHREKEVC